MSRTQSSCQPLNLLSLIQQGQPLSKTNKFSSDKLVGIARQLFHDLTIYLISKLAMSEAFSQEPPLFFKYTHGRTRERGGGTVKRVDHGYMSVRLQLDIHHFLSFAITHDVLNDLEQLDCVLVERPFQIEQRLCKRSLSISKYRFFPHTNTIWALPSAMS